MRRSWHFFVCENKFNTIYFLQFREGPFLRHRLVSSSSNLPKNVHHLPSPPEPLPPCEYFCITKMSPDLNLSYKICSIVIHPEYHCATLILSHLRKSQCTEKWSEVQHQMQKTERDMLRHGTDNPIAEWSSRLYFIHKFCGKLLAI